MIKIEKGIVEIEGTIPYVLSEFTVIVKYVRESLIGKGMSVEKAEEKINKCIVDSKMSVDELTEKIYKKLLERILSDIFGGEKHAD